MNIELHIDELVLRGFAQGDRYGIGAAVEQELTRLLAGQPMPSMLKQSTTRDHVDAGAFHLAAGAKPSAVGGQIASAIHGGLTR